ncbi:delta(7)-sterol-C5(6)-desaturase-like [Impatiens glandulifera]|uniref:delta(7)-sterol-C5(6)-desaturase-like n=1 Tax=Impatiens glandulifera TaxID=253017 RepID=UPI001FB105BE|nr:delta(7)-sterol-C5(6)-desaturase-like [Impatiens glandulifera]
MFVEENSNNNHMILGMLMPKWMWESLPHFYQTWMRNYISATIIYLGFGFFFYIYSYHLQRNIYFARESIPSNKAIFSQIIVSMKAIPAYSCYVTISEYVIENGWTKCFSRANDVSVLTYLLYLVIYLLIIEVAIYWVHRLLHDIKPLYKYLHSSHHVYNKKNIISPFAGLAFHPIDGILQAMPHLMALFIVPMHFSMHVKLMFIEGIWTILIHDPINVKNIWPMMGSTYHTIHHTTYKHNYGHYTILMDWMFGTLTHPKDDACQRCYILECNDLRLRTT